MDALLTLPSLGMEGRGGRSCCRVCMPIRYLRASVGSAILELEALPENMLLQGKPLPFCRDVRVYGLGFRAGPAFIFLLVGCATRVCCSIACSFCNVLSCDLFFCSLIFILHSHILKPQCVAVPTGHATFTRLLVSCANRTSLFLATFTLPLFG